MIKAYDQKEMWKNVPYPTTPIRPEMLNKMDETIVDFSPEKIKPKFTNCKNCGAPLKSTECEYCGTQYGRWEYDK